MKTEIDFIASIRAFRTVRDLPYDEAKRQVIAKFKEKGWPVPAWAERNSNADSRKEDR
jgi:hypothetical protein